VAGACLADAFTLTSHPRVLGPMRAGVTGSGWRRANELVAARHPAARFSGTAVGS
jgi:hypothetical protein